MFQKILVPIDGSPNSYLGLQYAADIAMKYDGEITLIHIVERPIYAFDSIEAGPGGGADAIFASLEKGAEKLFAKRKKELAEKVVRMKTLLKKGNPSVEILKASKGFDLIVMGGKGLGGLRTLLLGSVSNSVLQQSKVPVLVVRHK